MTDDERTVAKCLAKKFIEHGHKYPLPLDCMNLARALLDTIRELEATRAVVEAARTVDSWFLPFQYEHPTAASALRQAIAAYDAAVKNDHAKT